MRATLLSAVPTRVIVAAFVALPFLVSAAAVARDLYVAPIGDNSVSYAANSITSPWQTVEHGIYNVHAGDTLWVRGGVYTPKYPVWLASDFARQTGGGDPNERMNAQSGTQSAQVVIENYRGEQVTIDLAAMADAYLHLDNKSYWTFRGLRFINSAFVFIVGENYPTTFITFDQLSVQANRGGDNTAAIHLWSGNADYAVIRNCVIRGPGQGVHLNTGTIYLNAINHVSILGNTLSDAPIGIYFKHRNTATIVAQATIEVAYNYVTNTTRSSLEYNGSFSSIHDNIFGANTASAHFGDANGGAGADYNLIEHNTFLSGSLNFDSAIDSTDPFPGVVGNTVRDNLFMASLSVTQYTSAPNTNTFGRNVYPASNAIVSYNNLVAISSDSIIGKPTYVGGTVPMLILGFRLAPGSIGVKTATDGTDMGANIDKMLQRSVAPPLPPDPITVK